MPRGGWRPGSGRKPKDQGTAALHGSRQRSVVAFPAQPGQVETSAEPPTPLDPPEGLPAPAVAVWQREAPFALAAGTLTPGTVEAFALFCRAVVIELKLGKGKTAGGTAHRGMIAAVTAGRLRFAISPNGKPLAQPKKNVDPFAQFDKAAQA